jgi:signal transduction histidine kinase/putative methionine-R-sulfoxide reductase with GAF domain
LAREERVSRALREVGVALGTTLELDDLLELILNRLTDLLEADRATLYLLDEARRELVSRMVIGGEIRSIRLKVGHGIAGMVVQTGKAIRVKDAYSDARFEKEWDTLSGYRTTSMLAAPLKNHLGRTIGVIQVLNKRGGEEFSGEDEAILNALSTQAAVAIDNSRLFLSLIQKNKQLLDATEQLERRVRDLELLFELERSTARATTIEALSTAVLGTLARACEARGAALLLAEEETGDLVLHVYDHDHPERLERKGVKVGEGLLAIAMTRSEPVRIEAGQGRGLLHERVDGSLPFPVDNALATALEGEERPIGALGLFSKRGGHAFTDEDLALVRLVAANASTAVRLFVVQAQRERGERLTTIGRLLSQVIHDFKTPMTVISGYVQLMQDTTDAAKRGEYAEEVLKQFDVLTSMQREVLEFARGERRVFVRKVYLKKFFSDITRQLELEFAGRPIELLLDVDTKLVARFDESGVARAIHNLARNAVEAMGERGGKLTISARMKERELVITVTDTGPGIPKEIEDRLFQSFVTAGKTGGTGLGLAIVRKIAEEHGGSVSVRSSEAGATFEVRLPQPEPKPGDARRNGSGRTRPGANESR